MTTESKKRPLEGENQYWSERITQKHPRFTDPDTDLTEHQKKCHHPDETEIKDAISKGDMTLVKQILDKSLYCDKALVWAASSNNRDMVELIVDHKNANCSAENILPLYFNLRQKHEEFIVKHEKCIAEHEELCADLELAQSCVPSLLATSNKVLERMERMRGQ